MNSKRKSVVLPLNSTKKIDFAGLNRRLLLQFSRWVPQWLPGGRVESHEYVGFNPTRSDKNLGSFRINLKTGRWCDFATGDKGGDLISLYAYINGISQGSAAKELMKITGGSHD